MPSLADPKHLADPDRYGSNGEPWCTHDGLYCGNDPCHNPQHRSREEWADLPGAVRIELPLAACSPVLVEQLRATLTAHPGTRPVHLVLTGGTDRHVLRLAAPVTATPALRDQLAALLPAAGSVEHSGYPAWDGDPQRILVTISRSWTDPARVAAVLERKRSPAAVLVHGAAGEPKRPGIPPRSDWIAVTFWRGWGLVDEGHMADWARHGRKAGMLRNAEMVRLGADRCFAFLAPCTQANCDRPGPHPSHGASDCAERAERAGIPTLRIEAVDGLAPPHVGSWL